MEPVVGYASQGAITDFDAALVLEPSNDSALWMRGDAKRMLGNSKVK